MEPKFLVYSEQPRVLNERDIYIDIVGPVHSGKTTIGLAIAELLREAGIGREISLHTDDHPGSLLERKEKIKDILKEIGSKGNINAVRVGESTAPRSGYNVAPMGRRWKDIPVSKLPSDQEENEKQSAYAKDSLDYVYHLNNTLKLAHKLGLNVSGNNVELERLGISQEEMNIELSRGNWAEFYKSVAALPEEALAERRRQLKLKRTREQLMELSLEDLHAINIDTLVHAAKQLGASINIEKVKNAR